MLNKMHHKNACQIHDKAACMTKMQNTFKAKQIAKQKEKEEEAGNPQAEVREEKETQSRKREGRKGRQSYKNAYQTCTSNVHQTSKCTSKSHFKMQPV